MKKMPLDRPDFSSGPPTVQSRKWLTWLVEYGDRLKLLCEYYQVEWKDGNPDWVSLCMYLASDHFAGLRVGRNPGHPVTVETETRRVARRELLTLVEGRVPESARGRVPATLLERLVTRDRKDLPAVYQKQRCGVDLLRKELARARKERSAAASTFGLFGLLGSAMNIDGPADQRIGGLGGLGGFPVAGSIMPWDSLAPMKMSEPDPENETE
jgi:hypothetical protein